MHKLTGGGVSVLITVINGGARVLSMVGIKVAGKNKHRISYNDLVSTRGDDASTCF